MGLFAAVQSREHPCLENMHLEDCPIPSLLHAPMVQRIAFLAHRLTDVEQMQNHSLVPGASFLNFTCYHKTVHLIHRSQYPLYNNPMASADAQAQEVAVFSRQSTYDLFRLVAVSESTELTVTSALLAASVTFLLSVGIC